MCAHTQRVGCHCMVNLQNEMWQICRKYGLHSVFKHMPLNISSRGLNIDFQSCFKTALTVDRGQLRMFVHNLTLIRWNSISDLLFHLFRPREKHSFCIVVACASAKKWAWPRREFQPRFEFEAYFDWKRKAWRWQLRQILHVSWQFSYLFFFHDFTFIT